MWYNSLLARGLIPDWLLRRGVRSQGKERLNMMKKGNAEKLYSDFLNEASYGSIAVNTDDANNQHYEVIRYRIVRTRNNFINCRTHYYHCKN